MAGRSAFSFSSLRTPGGRQGPLPLPPWVRSYEQWKQQDSEDEEDSNENVERKSSSNTPRSKASRTAKPRVPLFAWERQTAEPGQELLLDDASRAERIKRAFRSAEQKTVLVRTWVILLFILYNLYSFYLAAGDIHNTIVIFHPHLATMKNENESPKQLVAGAFTYTSSSSRDRFIECFLEMLVSLLTKLIIWITIIPFMIICMHWKAEPRLHLEDLMPDSRDWPTVDIFLPRYKEAWESFEPTIRATLASPESEPPSEPPSTLDSSLASPAQLPLSPRGSARTPAGRVRFSFAAPRSSPRPSKKHSGSDETTTGSDPSPTTPTKPTPRKYILPSPAPRKSVKIQLPSTPFSSPVAQGLIGQPSPRRPVGPIAAPRFSFQSAPAAPGAAPGKQPTEAPGREPPSGQSSSQRTHEGGLKPRRSLQGAGGGPPAARKPPPLQIEGGRRASTLSTSTKIDEDRPSSGLDTKRAPSQSQPSMPDYPALDYPPSKLNIYICDDGARDPATSIENQVKNLVASLPPGMPMVHYITRTNALHAKAGNLNNALQHADGDLLVVFDSDHIASPGFLLDLVPHMLCQKKQTGDVEKGKPDASSWTLEGSRVGMIQSKQYFYNEHEFVPFLCGADNKIYYYLLQHGLNGLGATNCVGTGYVMNRKALDEIGGYVGGWAVEDSFTSTAIFKSGWVTKYTPDCEAIGLAPPTLSEHVQQRWRWSIGSVQLLLYGNYAHGLSFMRILGIVVGNWYPIALSAVFIAIIARLTCFVAYVFLATPQRTTATQVAISWLALAVLMVMPNVGIIGKIFDIVGLFILQSVHLTVTYYALIGRLNPAKKKVPKIKAASEVQGDFRLPPMVVSMTAIVVVIILAALLIQLLAPENANLELGMALTVSVLFMLVLVAAPVCLVVLYGILQSVKRMIRRKLRGSKAEKEKSPYPPIYFSKAKKQGQSDSDLVSQAGK